MKELNITSATFTATTLSGNTVQFDPKTVFYLNEQRDIEFMMDMAWTRFEKKHRFDYWGNIVIGIIIGALLIGLIN